MNFLNCLAGCLLLGLGYAAADPAITNLQVAQRTGTRLVDITYDLASPNGPAAISLEISEDGGTSYTVPATTCQGDLGPGIVSGLARKIVWNAGVDRPGRYSPNMRFRLCADDGLPPDSTFDISSLEFFQRVVADGAALTPNARLNVDLFVRECKRLGFWNQMMVVPCLEGYGAMHPLGGAPQRTNAKFVRHGATTLTPQGVKFIPGPNYANRVETPFDYNVADEPIFLGDVSYHNGAQILYYQGAWLRWNDASSQSLLYTWGTGDVYGSLLEGFGTPTSWAAQFRFAGTEIRTTQGRSHFAGAQFDGTGHTLRSCLNQEYRELTSTTGETGRPGAGRVFFYAPAPSDVQHVVQACVIFYGNVTGLPMKEFWPTFAGAFLSETSGKYVYLHHGGQSNSSFVTLRKLALNDWMQPTAPPFHTTSHSYGGRYISWWLGENPAAPVRTENYVQALNIYKSAMPAADAKLWDGVYFWMQGEMDSEGETLANNYLSQLRNLAAFLRADTRPDLIMAIGGIDFRVEDRNSAGGWMGNFTLSGCTGAAQAANGTMSCVGITGLANAFTDYRFTNGDWKLERVNGLWTLFKDGTTYYTSVDSVTHPCLVKAWTASNGATGAPGIGGSRDGYIEIMRAAEREFVATDPRAFFVDSRGCDRRDDIPGGEGDFVHMSVAGYTSFAEKFAAAFAAYKQTH